jgi:hypothetical protein
MELKEPLMSEQQKSTGGKKTGTTSNNDNTATSDGTTNDDHAATTATTTNTENDSSDQQQETQQSKGSSKKNNGSRATQQRDGNRNMKRSKKLDVKETSTGYITGRLPVKPLPINVVYVCIPHSLYFPIVFYYFFPLHILVRFLKPLFYYYVMNYVVLPNIA